MVKKRPLRWTSPLPILLVLAVSAAADGRMETVFIESDDPLIPSREVRVWLPPGYNTGDERYPVLYFHDGQNVFRPGGPFGCWFAEDAAVAEIKAGADGGGHLGGRSE
jgi:Predicted hydrolase of the alpha/beta superfamily